MFLVDLTYTIVENVSIMETMDKSTIEHQPHILVIDDDRRIRELLERYLTREKMVVNTAADAGQAREKLKIFKYDMLVVDVMMPGEDGLSLTRGLIKDGLTTPILLLTARSESEDRITGLEAGADDYLPKPFEPRELILRIQAILRRGPSDDAPTAIHFGDLAFDKINNTLVDSRNDENIPLTSVESQLLRALCDKSGHILSRHDLLINSDITGNERTIDVQVTRLRRKIEPDAKRPRYLQTIRGEGYVLRPDKR